MDKETEFEKTIRMLKSFHWPDNPKFPLYVRVSNGYIQMVDAESYESTYVTLEAVLKRYENDPVKSMIDFFNSSIEALNNANARNK